MLSISQILHGTPTPHPRQVEGWVMRMMSMLQTRLYAMYIPYFFKCLKIKIKIPIHSEDIYPFPLNPFLVQQILIISAAKEDPPPLADPTCTVKEPVQCSAPFPSPLPGPLGWLGQLAWLGPCLLHAATQYPAIHVLCCSE
jgi:hypothetical protein